MPRSCASVADIAGGTMAILSAHGAIQAEFGTMWRTKIVTLPS
jgi:hypothetical protein